MFKNKNKNLLIIGLIVLVNMLGYGIIIPILYSYSKLYGLSDFQNGLLFAVFSICQFFATPIIGRLSDRYGRKPMLLVSIMGTALSFFMMAFAPNVLFLFLARALDGITAGNIPVAFAVISDSTEPKDRPGAFGFIGSMLNFGFVFGPALAALTVGFGEVFPFIIAGIITVIAVILTALYLPETNKHIGHSEEHGKLFDFPKMWRMLFDKKLGVTFVISLLFFLAFACAIIYGFQPFTINVLKISTVQNSIFFTIFGAVGFISQTFLVQRIAKKLGSSKAFSMSILFTAISFLLMFFARSLYIFIPAMIILSLVNSISQTLIPTILSQETDERSQGAVMGLNASYQSIGMIVGPILGGFVATIAIPLPFLVGSMLMLVCFFLSFHILKETAQQKPVF